MFLCIFYVLVKTVLKLWSRLKKKVATYAFICGICNLFNFAVSCLLCEKHAHRNVIKITEN